MQQNPTQFKLGRLLGGLIVVLIGLCVLVYGSLTLHYQHQKLQQIQQLLAKQSQLSQEFNSVNLSKHLIEEWKTFQIAYPYTHFAIIETYADHAPKLLFSKLVDTSEPEKLRNHLLELSQQKLQQDLLSHTNTQNLPSAFFRQQWQSLKNNEQFFLAPFDQNNHWYFVAYQQRSWLPEFALQSLYNTLWIMTLLIGLTLLGFFLSLQKTSKHLQSTQNRYQQFIDHNLDWVWETDIHGTIIYSSEHSFALIGIDANKLLGVNLFSLIEPHYHPETSKELRQYLTQNEPFYNLELALKHSANKVIYGVFYGQPFFDKHNELLGFRGTCRDITAFKERQNTLLDQLHFDPVTELPNRLYLIENLNKLLAQIHPGDHYALLMLDLHGLQEVNDFHGHRYSTLSLHLSAERIRKTIAQRNLVCRLNGTEFAILIRVPLQGTSKEIHNQLELLAEELLYSLNQTMVFEEHSFTLQANVGITLIPENGIESSSLMANANQALYESKKLGYNHFRFATTDLAKPTQTAVKTVIELKKALSNNEFELHYQIQIDSLTHRIFGLEAQLFWVNPENRKVEIAQDFIKLAQEHNAILELELWMLDQVFADWQNLMESLKLQPAEHHLIPIFVLNLSSDTLISSELYFRIEKHFKDCVMPHNKLCIEISEGQLVRHANRAISAIHQLSELGIQFSIDHFGTGWSNLAYLQSLPIRYLKLDRSHTIDMAINPQHLEMTRTLIQMAHSLKIEMIAEGVESDTQKQLLQQNGCINMQGQLFAQSLHAKHLPDLIERHLNDHNSLQ